MLPTGATYTFYGDEQVEFDGMPLEKLVKEVVGSTLPIQAAKVFHIDQIVEAHRVQERNTAGSRIVALA